MLFSRLTEPTDYFVERGFNDPFMTTLNENRVFRSSFDFELPLLRKPARWHRIIANRGEDSAVCNVEPERQCGFLNTL